MGLNDAIPASQLRQQFGAPREEKGPPDLKRRGRMETAQPDGLPVPERNIQKAIIARLQGQGWLVVRVNSGGFKDRNGTFVRGYTIVGLDAISGFPDLVAFKGREFLLIEVKKPDGELTDSQERFQDFADGKGVRVHVLRDPTEVDGILPEVKG